MGIKKLLFLLLLFPAIVSAQIPGIMASQWQGVSVRNSLSVELYAENYAKGNAAVSAKWYDFQNKAVFASQSVVASMPTLVGNYVDFSLRQTMSIASLPSTLTADNNTFIVVAKPRDNALSYSSGYGPMYLAGAAGVAGSQVTSRKDFVYGGSFLYTASTIATESLRFISATVGALGKLKVNSFAMVTGNSGSTIPSTNLWIGRAAAGAYSLDGIVYAILIYSRKLSEAEVTTIFNELAAHYGLVIP